MSPHQKTLRGIRDQQSRNRQRLGELAAVADLNEEQRSELDSIEQGMPDLERRERAALAACESEDRAATVETVEHGVLPPEMRERVELRSRCRVGRIFSALRDHRPVDGAERELQQACGLDHNVIPLEIWESPVEQRADAPTVSPTAGVGQNLRPIYPKLLARSLANRVMGIAMPTTGTGTYATLRQNAGLTAKAREKGGAIESTAATFVSKTTTPHRVSARLSIQIEDKKLIGTTSFEARLRSNLANELAAELDRLAINGDPSTTTAEPQGLFGLLTDPTNSSAIETFDSLLAVFADAIDGGPLAESMRDIRLLTNPDVVKLAAKKFRDAGSSHRGDISIADYLGDRSGGLVAHSRMPATVSHIAACIRMRLNAKAMGEGSITYAECPIWQGVEMIVDPYSDSAAATTHFTTHLLIGDVILIQPSAYDRVDLKVSS